MATTLKDMFPTPTICITTEFVESYLGEAGFNPADFNISYLARIWREAVSRGITFDAGQHITADSIRGNDYEVFFQALNTFDWPEPLDVYTKYSL